MPGTAGRDLPRGTDDGDRTWVSHGREERSTKVKFGIMGRGVEVTEEACERENMGEAYNAGTE